MKYKIEKLHSHLRAGGGGVEDTLLELTLSPQQTDKRISEESGVFLRNTHQKVTDTLCSQL
uniref:Uncharacterized protein n=1 Tax=Salix viminalis TaxID=40686 RepID=A0A6N2MTG5_SALVM